MGDAPAWVMRGPVWAGFGHIGMPKMCPKLVLTQKKRKTRCAATGVYKPERRATQHPLINPPHCPGLKCGTGCAPPPPFHRNSVFEITSTLRHLAAKWSSQKKLRRTKAPPQPFRTTKKDSNMYGPSVKNVKPHAAHRLRRG